MNSSAVYLYPLPKKPLLNLEKYLSPKEHDRFLKMTSPKRRREFLYSRFLVKKIFQDIYSVPKPEISENKNGKPVIKNWKFNLSHSGKYIALAVNPTSDVGLDIERSDFKKYFLEIAKQYFSSKEVKFIQKPKSRSKQFLNFKKLWVLKESYIKAFNGDVNSNSLKVYFDFEHGKIDNLPTRKKTGFFYNSKFNLSLCQTGEVSSLPQSYSIRFESNRGLKQRKINLDWVTFQ